MTDRSPFPGNRFSNDDLSPEERAQHREMYHKLSDAWPTVEAMSNIFKGGKAVRNLVATGVVIGSAIAFAVKQGFFG